MSSDLLIRDDIDNIEYKKLEIKRKKKGNSSWAWKKKMASVKKTKNKSKLQKLLFFNDFYNSYDTFDFFRLENHNSKFGSRK